ncbi:MAG: hypothetical protein JOZ83_16690 [Silvibacterium sp.]|nr:hypothetical protein [Silvibacterium sp.]
MNLEELRQQYHPDPIRVLFVGESRPAGGTFFYKGDSGLARYTKQAFQHAYDLPELAMADYLSGFKAAGCYLDDLCLEPVNRMSASGRRAAWKRAVEPMANRLREYSPGLIVPMLRSIESRVRQAAEKAGLLDRMRPALPYPGMGFHSRYITQLSRLLVELREASILPLYFL